MRLPFDGTYPITQRYGATITSAFHTGVDFGLPEGTPVYAVCDGVIQQIASEKSGYGKYIILRPTGEVGGYLYGHLSGVIVEQNREVAEGDLIGYSGNTGNSTGAHLHFEVRMQWDKWATHYKPEFSTQPSTAFEPQALQDGLTSAVVVAPAGANLRDDNLNLIGTIANGARVSMTGNIRYDHVPRREVVIKGWLAEHDGETQILEGDQF